MTAKEMIQKKYYQVRRNPLASEPILTADEVEELMEEYKEQEVKKNISINLPVIGSLPDWEKDADKLAVAMMQQYYYETTEGEKIISSSPLLSDSVCVCSDEDKATMHFIKNWCDKCNAPIVKQTV